MTDRDIMIYLRNTALALRQIAQERGIKISICVSPVTEEPYVTIRAGYYEYVDFGEKPMSYADNPVMDAEYMAEIRSRTILRKRARIAYEEAEMEGNKYGRTENNCIATVGKYPV